MNLKFIKYFFLIFLLLSLKAFSISFNLKNIIIIPENENTILQLNEPVAKELDPKSIKILVWNIYRGQKENWNNDFLTLSKDKDLILLQEGFLDENMNHVFKNLDNFLYLFATSFIYESSDTPTGVVTACPVTPKKISFQRTKDKELVKLTPKIILFSTYPLKNHKKDLLVVNIHGLNFVTSKVHQKQIRKALKKLVHHDGPVIFAGDFNTWSEKRLKFVRRKMKQYKFIEVNFESSEQRPMPFDNPIDHVFVKGLDYKDAQVVVEVESSDHKALVVEVKIKE